jgi:hypothetical protein
MSSPFAVGPVEVGPDAYEAPNGMEAVVPGMPDDAGSRDPSATSVGGAMSNAAAQMAEMRADGESPAGSHVGDPLSLPSNVY